MSRSLIIMQVLIGSLAIAPTVSASSAQVTQVDSAGVVIVNSASHQWSNMPWTIADAPTTTVGGVDGTPDLTMVSSAVLTTDGRLIIADAGARFIHGFSPDGQHLWTAGGPGGGPREFQQLMEVARFPGDSIIASGHTRFSIFDTNGSFGRTRPVQPTAAFIHTVAGVAESGHLILFPAMVSGTRRPAADDDGWLKGPIQSLAPNERQARTVVDLPYGFMPMVNGQPAPGAYRTYGSGTTDGEHVYWSRNDRAEVRVFALDGSLQRIIRWGEPPRPITKDIDAQLESELRATYGSLPDMSGPRLETVIANLMGGSRPAALPYHGRLLLDTEGFLWISSYGLASLSGPEWRVFDPTGRWLGAITMPNGEVSHITLDKVVVIQQDEFDVPIVSIYELTRR